MTERRANSRAGRHVPFAGRGATIVWVVVLLAATCPSAVLAQSRKTDPKEAAHPRIEDAKPVKPLPADAAERGDEPVVIEQKDIRVRRDKPKKFNLEEALAAEPFVFEMGARRDPFNWFASRPETAHKTTPEPVKTSPPPPKPVVEEPPKPPKPRIDDKTEMSVTDQRQLVVQAEGLLAKAKQRIAARDYATAVSIQQKDLPPLLVRMPKITDADLKARITAVDKGTARITEMIAQAKLDDLYRELNQLNRTVNKAWEAADYEKVVYEAKAFDAAFAKGRELMLAGVDPKKQLAIANLKNNVDQYRHRAEVRIEFSKKTFVITGIAWSQRKSFAIINNQDISEGEVIDDVKVVKIRPGRITMQFKGETFEKFSN